MVYPHVQSDVVGPISLIIGSDYCARFLHKSWRHSEIALYSSPAGNLIAGVLPQINKSKSNQLKDNTSIYVDQTIQLMVARIGAERVPGDTEALLEEENEPVHKLWDLDTIGIDITDQSPEDKLTMEHYQ